MENNNGLDLTLSLPCGGPSTSFNGKNGVRPENGAEESDRGSKLIDEFKNFLDGGNQKIDSIVFSQGSNQPKPEAKSLFYDLSRANANVDSSSNINNGGFWGKNESISTEIQEDRRAHEAGSLKLNHQKRHERDTHLADLHDKTKRRNISITTDENSAAENEDVADSEAEGSTSKLVEHHDGEYSRIYARNVGLSEGAKEVHGGFDSYSVSFSGQSVNILNMPYPLSAKESNSNTGMRQVMGAATNVRPGSQQPVVPANMSLMFGYSPIHVPSVEPVNAPNPPKDDAKYAKEDASSSHTENNMKGINGNDMTKSKGTHETAEVVLPEYPAIRPGIAAELKFGGSGSSPNLPWVSTTGPNGKTISGVTYKCGGTHIRIVCACHGSHMSPEEFVRHAAGEEQLNPNGEGGSCLAQTQG